MDEVIRTIKVDSQPRGRPVRRYLALFLGVLVLVLASLGSLIAHRRNAGTIQELELRRLSDIVSALAQSERAPQDSPWIETESSVSSESGPSEKEAEERLKKQILAFRAKSRLAMAGSPKAFLILRRPGGEKLIDSRLADEAPDLIFDLAGFEDAARALRELKTWRGELMDRKGQVNLVAVAFDSRGNRIVVGLRVDELEESISRQLHSTSRWLMIFGFLLLPLSLIGMALIWSGPKTSVEP